jgi:hypothetical protein
LVRCGIEVRAQATGIDARRALRRIGDHRPRHEPAGRYRAKLGNRHTVAADDERLARLHLPEDGGGVVAQLTLVMILRMGGL